jgi:hypothetical protein
MLSTRLGMGLCVALAASVVIAAPARADTVTDWHAHAVTALGATARQTPPPDGGWMPLINTPPYPGAPISSARDRARPRQPSSQ